MDLRPGDTLGQFRIVGRLGKGGMGEVFAAEDPELKRSVAIKVLPSELAGSPERLERFRREAQVVASLDHPNIVVVHSLEQHDGVHFLTMQLVQGETLHDFLRAGPLPLEALFRIVIPLVDAVAAAHRNKVLHRDLKPANVMVAEDGTIKVLDFGLAKLAQEAETDAMTTAAEAPETDLTEEGQVLGTVSYMSPEQAEGKPVDARSDIFALGILLYEMATGDKPFRGDSKLSVMSAILKDSPRSVIELKPDLPRHLGRIIGRALEKDPDRRYQTALDLRNDLEQLREEVRSGDSQPAVPSAAAGPQGGRKVAAVGIVIALMTIAALAIWWSRGKPEDETPPAPQPTITRLTERAGFEVQPSISPDGEWVVYEAHPLVGDGFDLWLQRVDGRNPIDLTKGASSFSGQAAFSKDGRQLAFVSNRPDRGLFVMGVTGESLRKVLDFEPGSGRYASHPSWSPDGRSLAYATRPNAVPHERVTGRSEIWVLDLDSGESRLVAPVDAIEPHWSPDGRWIVFWGLTASTRELFAVPADGSAPPKRLTETRTLEANPFWAGEWLYFASDRTGPTGLWRQRIDPDTAQLLGEPVPLVSPSAYAHQPSVSADGRRIAFVARSMRSVLIRRPLDPITLAPLGEPETLLDLPRGHGQPEVSPDGDRVLLHTRPVGGQEDLFVLEPDGTRRTLTDDVYYDRNAAWSSDGRRVLFQSDRGGRHGIWELGVDDGNLRSLTDDPTTDYFHPEDSPDSQWVVAQMISDMADSATALIHIDRPLDPLGRRVLPPVHGSSGALNPVAWSPDGRWIVGNAGGTYAYSVEDDEYRLLWEASSRGRWVTLQGTMRYLFRTSDGWMLWDPETGELASSPHDYGSRWMSISPDQRWVYDVESTTNADIWLMDLAPESGTGGER